MNKAKFFVIRRSITIFALAAVIAFAFSACDDGSDNGGNGGSSGGGQTFTLVGIPAEYNGRYAYLAAETETGGVLIGAQSVNMATQIITLVRILNGRVNLPMWIFDVNFNNLPRYSGNHSGPVMVVILNSANLPFEGSAPPVPLAAIGFQSVSFSNGSATRAFSDGQPVEEFE